MSGKVVPLKRPPAASPESPGPWIPGEVFTRDGVDYELVSEEAAEKASRDVLDLLRDAGALVGDHVLVLRRTRPA